jgi:hypothetical protein
VSVQRYYIDAFDGVVKCDDGPLVEHDDHEAAIRIQAARSEAIGMEACKRELTTRCRVWGMSVEECEQHATFPKLLSAFEQRVIWYVTREPKPDA